MGFPKCSTLLLVVAIFHTGYCQLTTVTVTAPTTIWDENDADLVCDFTGLDNANLAHVKWYSPTISDSIYIYDGSTDAAQGAYVGRATGVLGASLFTLTVTNVTVAGDNGDSYWCVVEDDAANTESGQTTLNVAVLCEPSPCQNGATCSVDTASSYSCQCPTDFTGQHCEHDMTTTAAPTTDVTKASTSNNALVTNPTSLPTTTAASTTAAAIDECASDPCQNGGTCSDLDGDYSCACTSCWAGSKNCNIQAVDECASNPCQNGGTCNDGCSGYTCSCPYGSGGDHCETACSHITSLTPAATTAVLGSSVTLTCTAAAGSAISWSRSADGSNPIGTGSTYTISSVSQNEGVANYYCFATLSSCTSRDSTKITATWDAEFNGTAFENKTVEAGESLTLSAEFDSSPAALLHWRFTGMPQSKNEGNETVEEIPDTVEVNNRTYGNTSYTIESAAKDQEGHYECFAELPGGLTYRLKSTWVSVEGDDKHGGKGLKGWQIALIVIGIILLIVLIIVIVLLIIMKKKKGSVQPNQDKEKQQYQSNGNDDSTKSALGLAKLKKSSKYEKINENEREKHTRDEAYHSDLELKPRKKKNRLLKRRTIDGDDDDYERSRYNDDNPRPLPDHPTGRGRTLPPLNLDEEKSKTKKKSKKKRVEEEEEEDDRSDRDE